MHQFGHHIQAGPDPRGTLDGAWTVEPPIRDGQQIGHERGVPAPRSGTSAVFVRDFERNGTTPLNLLSDTVQVWKATDCVFCAIVRGTEPSWLVMDSPLAIAFLDINPAVDGHTLVAPRDHLADIFALEGEVAAAVWALTLDVARRLNDVLSPDGLTMFQANREAGWQDVFHFHIHLVPRWTGDSLVRPWHLAPGDTQKLESIADRLRKG